MLKCFHATLCHIYDLICHAQEYYKYYHGLRIILPPDIISVSKRSQKDHSDIYSVKTNNFLSLVKASCFLSLEGHSKLLTSRIYRNDDFLLHFVY